MCESDPNSFCFACSLSFSLFRMSILLKSERLSRQREGLALVTKIYHALLFWEWHPRIPSFLIIVRQKVQGTHPKLTQVPDLDYGWLMNQHRIRLSRRSLVSNRWSPSTSLLRVTSQRTFGDHDTQKEWFLRVFLLTNDTVFCVKHSDSWVKSTVGLIHTAWLLFFTQKELSVLEEDEDGMKRRKAKWMEETRIISRSLISGLTNDSQVLFSEDTISD